MVEMMVVVGGRLPAHMVRTTYYISTWPVAKNAPQKSRRAAVALPIAAVAISRMFFRGSRTFGMFDKPGSDVN
jgi:hypothetical protein